MAKNDTKLTVETITHDKATRKNIPTAEFQSVMAREEEVPYRVTYERGSSGLDDEKATRNRDLDPQLIWRGKDEQDWSDLVVHAPPLYIQEKVHPKVLIDDLLRQTKKQEKSGKGEQLDLFSDFNGLPKEVDRTEFYRHEGKWQNRMILGDSLHVMASLAEREGLRGKVQCIYIDPPYGIKFNSNFQWSTTSRDVKDGNIDHITREPEQVKAFRDTWRDGIHSYLTYLRDRLTAARDLLTESGSIFVQIGDENVHRVRALMDEVFGEENFVSQIVYPTTSTQGSNLLPIVNDNILWFAKAIVSAKYRQLYNRKRLGEFGTTGYTQAETPEGNILPVSTIDSLSKDMQVKARVFASSDLTSSHYSKSENIMHFGREFTSKKRYWSTSTAGMYRLQKANRLLVVGDTLRYKRFLDDFDVLPISNLWNEQLSEQNKSYVVQTAVAVIERCILMSTDPGDLVLDPTGGSGTTAYVSEQWGRRWISIDTSRVAMALSRARIMGARYPYYLLADSHEGQLKEAEVTRSAPSSSPTHGDIRHGFVYERVPHITLKSIANNAEIDVIWEKYQEVLEPLRVKLNETLSRKWEEWEIPREAEDPWDSETQKIFFALKSERDRGDDANAKKLEEMLHAINQNLTRNYTLQTLPQRPADPWAEPAIRFHAEWWQQRIARQKEIDASIAAKAEFEYLYDKPYEAKKTVRVAGPFTVESLSPHRVLGVGADDELLDPMVRSRNGDSDTQSFVQMVLETLRVAGVQQSHKEDKIAFTSLAPWPGHFVCAEGSYADGDETAGTEKRAAIFIGPEFGTVSRPDLVAAAREAGDGGFDVLIACAFNYDAHSAEFDKLGRIPILKARMNADLHMADDLKNTGKGNLFVVFGEPDIEIIDVEDNQIQVKVNGVDVFHPTSGEVRSDGPEGIACWFIDTDYNEESFFVRHAYFLGANDPYKSLKTTLKAEINKDAWATLNSNISRPFDKPTSGRIAVKVINHLGDEVMKVFRV